MADGGSGYSAINELGGRIPQDAIEAVKEIEAQIMSGELTVPLNVEVPQSD